MFLSETLLHPVKQITRRLARMNENFLEPIETKELPSEFIPLGESINKLIDRIQNFVKYQKELFIGTSHELKTPLAVMKAKNEVTLMREREPSKYQETLKLNNKTIDEMNSMISSILEIGRQEGAQFEKPVEVDLVQFLKDKSKDFTLIAKNVDKNISIDLEPKMYCVISQPSLLTHILQNFVQNAIKFTPEGGNVHIKSRLDGDDFKIEVIDEGSGVDEALDLFAPFKRVGREAGAGLGLFLAKGAADAIGAELSLKNRSDGRGAVASLVLNSRNYCPIDDDSKGGIFSAFRK
jgi:two-component system OmpR family sensor kinase